MFLGENDDGVLERMMMVFWERMMMVFWNENDDGVLW